MNIQWLGYSCFKIQAKILDKEVVVLTDPYSPSPGLKLPKIHADIITSSNKHSEHNNISAIAGVGDKDVFIITSPGEYEKSGVFIRGILSYLDKSSGITGGMNTIYRIDVEDLSVVHLGALGHILHTEQLEAINGVDILLVPVGGHNLSMEDIKEIISQIEPKIIIPMHYQIGDIKPVGVKLESVDKFLHSMDTVDAEKLIKLKINCKDLEKGSRKVIVLEKV